MERVRVGDPTALEALFETYWSRLVEYARRLLDDPDAANDVALGTFVRAWNQRRRWRPTGSVGSFLFRIARNLALDEWRKSQVRTRWAQDMLGREPARRPPTPDDFLAGQETQAAIDRAVDGLPSRRRETFILAYQRGLTYREIAKVMGTSPQTAANQLARASEHIRRVLSKS